MEDSVGCTVGTSPAGAESPAGSESLPTCGIFAFKPSIAFAFPFPPLSSPRFTSRNMAVWFLTKMQEQFNGEREVCPTNAV